MTVAMVVMMVMAAMIVMMIMMVGVVVMSGHGARPSNVSCKGSAHP